MKFRFLLFTVLLIAQALHGSSQTFNVATFNLRLDTKGDSLNPWKERAPVIANLIRFHDFDIFGTQEGFRHQIDEISRALPQYSRYGAGRDDGKEAGEHSAIYFKKEKYRLLNSGDFWLSQTPDVPGKGWDATCCNRISSWVQLQDIKSRKKMYVFNVHFDHQGVVARRESARLMLRKIGEIAGSDPVILTGDFNGDRDSEWYKTLAHSDVLRDSYHDVRFPYENNSSMNSFRTPRGMAVIDHIFISKHFKAVRWGILTDTYFGKYPSDHFPVLTTLKYD